MDKHPHLIKDDTFCKQYMDVNKNTPVAGAIKTFTIVNYASVCGVTYDRETFYKIGHTGI
jgi:hypothetical protein